MTPRSDGRREQQTRRRVLAVATRLFAELGFKKVTVRAICRAAHANVAAVNYHFRDKLGLYTEVLESAVTAMREATDAAIAAGEGEAPEQKIEAYVRVVSERMFAHSGNTSIHQLIQREVSDPTPAVSTLIDRGLRPRLEYLGKVIGELLSRPADDSQVMMCVSSIHAQIVMFRPTPFSDRIRSRFNLPEMTPDVIADHIVRFSLAGLEPFRTAVKPSGRVRAARASSK